MLGLEKKETSQQAAYRTQRAYSPWMQMARAAVVDKKGLREDKS